MCLHERLVSPTIILCSFRRGSDRVMGACREARSSFGCPEGHLMVRLRFQALENALAEKSAYSRDHSDPGGRNHMLHGNRIGLPAWFEHHSSRRCAENGNVEKSMTNKENDRKSKEGRECHKYKEPLESRPTCHIYRSGSDGEQGKVPLCRRTALCPTRMDQGAEGDGAGDDVARAGRLLSPPLPSRSCIAFSNCLW
jgi:hypothetical protein